MIVYLVIAMVALIIATIYIYLINKDIKHIIRDIHVISQSDTQMNLTTETYNKNIVKLINEINVLVNENRKSNLHVKKVDAEIKQMISNMTHDFRTPLTSALGYIGLINDEKLDNDLKLKYIPIIQSRLTDLKELINDFYDLIKISEKSEIITIEKINLSELIEESLLNYFDEFAQKNIKVDIDILANIMVYSNTRLISRVFQNLIQNVIIHGQEEFSLKIINEKDIKIIFKNKSDNINDIELDKIYNRFYTSSKSRMGKSSGLGLVIVKEIMEQLGGKITIKLNNEEFEVVLLIASND